MNIIYFAARHLLLKGFSSSNMESTVRKLYRSKMFEGKHFSLLM